MTRLLMKPHFVVTSVMSTSGMTKSMTPAWATRFIAFGWKWYSVGVIVARPPTQSPLYIARTSAIDGRAIQLTLAGCTSNKALAIRDPMASVVMGPDGNPARTAGQAESSRAPTSGAGGGEIWCPRRDLVVRGQIST